MKKSYRLIPVLFILFALAAMGFTNPSNIPNREFSNPQPVAQEATPMPLGIQGPSGPDAALNAPVHGLYFYSEDCSHCQAIYNEIIIPLKEKYGDQLDLRLINISNPTHYELLIKGEEAYGVEAKDRGLPTTFLGDQVLSGEDANRSQMESLIDQAFAAGSLDWPVIPGLDPATLNTAAEPTFTPDGVCSDENPSACETDAPIYAAYFYQVGCQSCSRVEADLSYLRSKYPQLILEEYNIYDDAALGDWLAKRAGRGSDFHSPSLFIGDSAWIGEEEITPDAVESALQQYQNDGSPEFWKDFDPNTTENSLIEDFKSMRGLTVVFAGLIDGLNPCAFATLIFFVSYLSISGRKGREVLFVGASFTLGVFIAYLTVGLGFYRVLDVLGSLLTQIGRWVYGLTAVMCLTLAVVNLVDFFKVRKGGTEDMSLKLPETLRKRINSTIRKGRNVEAYAAGAFVTGIVVSFLELACTGQIYLPTIIFVSSIPELRLQAVLYLILYNLMFIVPLIVVFFLAYFGTTSNDLVKFLEKHSATIKIAMTVLFLALGLWLIYSLLAL